MKKLLLASLCFLMLCASQVFAQSRTVTGTITAKDDGLPLPGVSVRVTGTTNGTLTNAQGVYTITVPTAAKSLTFSSVGYSSQDAPVNGRSTISLALVPNSRALGEVVVTGYGTQAKSEVTGSISAISGKEIERLPVQTFDKALQGRAAGVQVTTNSGQPGSGITINIRGIATVNGSTSPLYIIDGVQVPPGGLSTATTQNVLGNINPADIESIEIIKDAATASIYGSQAGNGVVLVTTKRGKAGKTSIKASAQFGVNQELNPYKVLNSDQYYALRVDAIRTRVLATGANFNNEIAALNASILSVIGGTSLPASLPSTDFYNELFKKGHTSQYDVSAQGGDQSTKFFVSGSYQNTEGTINNSLYKRGTIRANVETKLANKLTFETSLNISGTLSKGPTTQAGFFTNAPFTGTLFQAPFNHTYNADGSYNTNIYPYNENITQDVDLEQRSTGTFQTISHASLSYEPIKGLVAKAFGGIEFADARNFNYRPVTLPAAASTNGSGTEGYIRNIDWNVSGTVNYTHTFATDHHLNVLAGVEYKETNQYNLSASAQQFSTPLLSLLSSASQFTSESSSITGYKLFSYLGSVRYDYKGKYLFNANIRDDGSSRFGANKKFGLFGGASIGWRLSQEDFLKNVSWLSDLKVKASYGITGVQPTGDFQSLDQFAPPAAAGGYLGLSALRQTVLGNSQLSWEQSAQVDLGLDFGLFNSRVTGSVDFYKKHNTKLLLPLSLTPSSGFASITQNVGVVDAKGIDIDLNTVNVDTHGFQWTTNFNIAFTQNKLISLYNGLQFINTSRNYQVGQPLNTYWYFQYAGVNPADGRPLYLDKNQNLTYNPVTADNRNVGDSNPDFFGGFGNTFSYKGLSLDVLFQYQYGNESFIQAAQVLEASGASTDNQLVSQLGRWTTPGQITSIPRAYDGFEPLAYDPTNLTSRYIQTASYIRLKQVSLAYKLPKAVNKKLGLQGVTVFVQGLNLGTITNYRGQDPENTGNNLQAYPNAKTFTGGLTIDL
jgi:TonB-linked SusC/RagA family outer membrane protein